MSAAVRGVGPQEPSAIDEGIATAQSESQPFLPICYGSQTGTACEVSHYISGLAIERGWKTWVGPFDVVEEVSVFPLLHLCIFVISTTGDGDTPEGMHKAWKVLLQKSLSRNALEGLHFSVLSLGDSSYEKFCAAGRRLRARLLQLGATELISPGYADDQSPCGTWGDVDEWAEQLFSVNAFQERCKKPQLSSVSSCRQSPISLNVKFVNRNEKNGGNGKGYDDSIDSHFYSALRPSGCSSLAPSLCTVARKEIISAEGHTPAVYHIEFAKATMVQRPTEDELSNHNSTCAGNRNIFLDQTLSCPLHNAGDVAWIHPCNPMAEVEKMAELMGLELSQLLEIQPRKYDIALFNENVHHDEVLINEKKSAAENGGMEHDSNNNDNTSVSSIAKQQFDELEMKLSGKGDSNDVGDHLPQICSVKHLFEVCLDICSVPRRAFFEHLAAYAKEDEEAEKLCEIASPAGADILIDYCTRERRTYIEVLTDFQSARPPLGALLAMIPPLKPRGFSIASSELENPRALHLCVTRVEYTTFHRRHKIGVCSSWLSGLELGDHVRLWIQPGSFHPPPLSTPLILVGPGTGIAPIRAIVQERKQQRRLQQRHQDKTTSSCNSAETLSPSKDVIFFGCRFRNKDFLYEHEWFELIANTQNRTNDESANGYSIEFHAAFSRDQPVKEYVQHLIGAHSSGISRLLVKEKAHVFVSGNAKRMPTDVRLAFITALTSSGDMEFEEAQRYVKAMEREKRYQVAYDYHKIMYHTKRLLN